MNFVYKKYNYVRKRNGLKAYSQHSVFIQEFITLRKVDLNSCKSDEEVNYEEKGPKS